MKLLLALFVLVVDGLFSLASAWALMLFIGILHHELSHDIPAVGYWPAFRISLGASLVIGIWRASRATGEGFVEGIKEVRR